MNRAALHNLIEAYQEARNYKLRGLQQKLRTLQNERELSRKKVTHLGARPIRIEI